MTLCQERLESRSKSCNSTLFCITVWDTGFLLLSRLITNNFHENYYRNPWIIRRRPVHRGPLNILAKRIQIIISRVEKLLCNTSNSLDYRIGVTIIFRAYRAIQTKWGYVNILIVINCHQSDERLKYSIKRKKIIKDRWVQK